MALTTALPEQRASVRRKRWISGEAVTGWLFALPLILYFVVWVWGPILASMCLTFFDWNALAPLDRARFIGLGNLRELSMDARFQGTFVNTFIYTIVVVAGGATLGLLLALALNAVNRFVGLLRAIYFLPYILPMTAMALIWGLLYQPAYGLFNQVLEAIGLPPSQWIYGTETALLSICFLVIWKSVGYYMIIFIAGLKAIQREVYEAAEIDGANAWSRFWWVTLPLLKPTVLFICVVSIIEGLQVFSPIFILTKGGPANATDMVVYRMYATAWGDLRFSYATAMGVVLFVVIFVITLLQMRLLREGGMTSYYR